MPDRGVDAEPREVVVLDQDQVGEVAAMVDAPTGAHRGFQEAANLDDGDLWPISYALTKWSPGVEKKVVELVKAATS